MYVYSIYKKKGTKPFNEKSEEVSKWFFFKLCVKSKVRYKKAK